MGESTEIETDPVHKGWSFLLVGKVLLLRISSRFVSPSGVEPWAGAGAGNLAENNQYKADSS